MQSRASHALIGLFTLAFVAALLGGAYWFSSGGNETVNVRLIFNGKVSGLGRGSSVLFNGLRVGEVTQIEIQPDNPRQISAVIKVNRSAPLRVDTSARLEGQGLAGVVAVQLRGGDPHAAALTVQAGQALPIIIAEPSDDIFEKVNSIAKSVDGAIGGIESAIEANAGPVGDTIKNVEQFSAALGDNSESVDKLMKNIGAVAEFIAPLPDKLGAFSEGVTETMRSVDRDNIVSVIERSEKFTATLEGAATDVSKTLKNVASVSEKLNRAADQVDGVLKGAQSFLNTAAGQNGRSAFDDVADAAKSIRALADSLDKRSAEITAEIARFTGSALQSIENLTTDGGRRLKGFSRTLREVDRNPQGLIFGSKPQIPQYNGPR